MVAASHAPIMPGGTMRRTQMGWFGISSTTERLADVSPLPPKWCSQTQEASTRTGFKRSLQTANTWRVACSKSPWARVNRSSRLETIPMYVLFRPPFFLFLSVFNADLFSQMFYVARGVVRAMIYRTQVTVAEGGFLMVPRGNQYKIENMSDVDDARLVFMQGREVPVADPEEDGVEEGEEQPEGEEEGQEEE
jgi:hypothetical protein